MEERMPEEHEFDHLAGELLPGDTGWLPLDESGFPAGPATLDPPEGMPGLPPALACSVTLTSDGHLVSSSGASLEPPLNSNVDRRVNEGVEDPITELIPILNSLNPASAGMGDPDFTLEGIGSNCTPKSVIVFNGGDENTTFVDATKVTTGVKPSLVSTPITVPVHVRNSLGQVSEPRGFEFETDLAEGETRRRSLL
jgi:hypothetical protein